jgi:hypothetical protein
MPRIELITVPLYNPTDPYHYEFDNLPLKNILRRQNLINLSLDNVIEQIRDAIGTQGSMANRLNQSINADGSLKPVAIDEALHSVEEHEDTEDYVRMLRSESDKLALTQNEATNTSLEIQLDDNGDDVVLFNNGPVRLVPSPTVTLAVESPNKVSFNLGFPLEAAHRHYYDQEPVPLDLMEPDFINYKVNTAATPIVSGTLRVYINGVRLSASTSIYVPGALVNDPWTLMTYVEHADSGEFALSTAVSEEDVVRIDYDISYI